MKFNLKSRHDESLGPRLPLLLGACLLASLPPATAMADPPGGFIPAPPPSTPFATVDYSALWSETALANSLVMADDLAAFEAEIASRAAAGVKLEAFESWLAGGTRRYGGIFRSSAGTRVLATGLDAAAFEAERLAQLALGRRLVDVEVELVAGERVYSGLFKSGIASAGEVVRETGNAADFEAEIADLTTYNLATFDTWWEDDELHAYGLFRKPAYGDLEVVVGRSWASFRSRKANLESLGYQLIDIEITEVPGNPADPANPGSDLFSGRFLSGPVTRRWLSVCLQERDHLVVNNWLFNAGFDFGARSIEGEELPGPPTEDPMYLIDLEIGVDWTSGTPNHLKPIHDCGTPGPPKGQC